MVWIVKDVDIISLSIIQFLEKNYRMTNVIATMYSKETQCFTILKRADCATLCI